MKKNVFQRLWEWILSLFPKQEIEIPEPKKEEPIPEEPEEVPPATEPEPEPEPEPEEEEEEEEEEEGIVSPWGINPVKAELSDIKSSSKLNGFISVDNINGYKVIHEHFHTISDMLKCFRRRENNIVMREEHESQEPEKDYTWYGTNSYEEAVKLLREGYIEILPRIKSEYKKNVDILSEKFSISKSRPIDSFCGGIPNVPNMLLGLPKTMLNRNPIVRRIKTIDIVYSPTGPGYVGPKRFIEAGIALLSAIELIERSRIQIRLISCFASSYIMDEAIFGTVVIKEYSDRLDIQKLCFPLAHPSMLRRIGFKFTETVPGMTRNFADGYGRAMEYSQFCSLYKRKPQTVLLSMNLIMQFQNNVEKLINFIEENARRK